jgi:hypothetical protein
MIVFENVIQSDSSKSLGLVVLGALRLRGVLRSRHLPEEGSFLLRDVLHQFGLLALAHDDGIPALAAPESGHSLALVFHLDVLLAGEGLVAHLRLIEYKKILIIT